MRSILKRFFAHEVKGTEPRIVELEQPIKIIGLSVSTDIKSIYRDLPKLGKRFQKTKREDDIPNKTEPWAFAAVSKDFDENTKTFLYIIGDVVTSFDQVPAGLMSFEIPAIEYAVLPVRPKNRFGWGIAIGSVKEYVYSVWLPASEYEPAGIIGDFEYHDEKSTRKKNPEIDLCVAVRKSVLLQTE